MIIFNFKTKPNFTFLKKSDRQGCEFHCWTFWLSFFSSTSTILYWLTCSMTITNAHSARVRLVPCGLLAPPRAAAKRHLESFRFEDSEVLWNLWNAWKMQSNKSNGRTKCSKNHLISSWRSAGNLLFSPESLEGMLLLGIFAFLLHSFLVRENNKDRQHGPTLFAMQKVRPQFG